MLAGQTPGFTGADLAALSASGVADRAHGQPRDLDDRARGGDHAGDRRAGEENPGHERKGAAHHRLPRGRPRDRRAAAAQLHPVHKISIISRGQALGYTISLPTEDKFLTTRMELTDTLAMTLGGRAAEEIVFGEITTGASNDLEKVTETAKQMVMRFGMSERLGPRVFGHDRGQPFLGREFSAEPDYSDEIAREIDDEIRRIVESAHQTAKDLLNENREELERSPKSCSSARRSTPRSSSPCSTASRRTSLRRRRRGADAAGRAGPGARTGRPRGRPADHPPAARLRRRRRQLAEYHAHPRRAAPCGLLNV